MISLKEHHLLQKLVNVDNKCLETFKSQTEKHIVKSNTKTFALGIQKEILP